MTDRINMIFVALETDVREDDVQELLSAIRRFRGVLRADMHVCEPSDWLAQARAKHAIREQIWALLK